MTTADAFTQAIIESPEDDVPRLVYADWLEEHGDPRGEFLRAQCLLARLNEADPRWPGLKRREAELLARHEADWLGAWRGRAGRWAFQRGRLMVELGDPSALSVLENEAETAAWTEGARLWGRCLSGPASALSSPALLRLVALDLSAHGLQEDGPAALAATPYVANVRALNLSGCGLRPQGLAALAASAHLTRVTALDLSGNGISAAGLTALGSDPRLPSLTTLDSAVTPWATPASAPWRLRPAWPAWSRSTSAAMTWGSTGPRRWPTRPT
jgi:uncharacterized protein (TIGR02996 family)